MKFIHKSLFLLLAILFLPTTTQAQTLSGISIDFGLPDSYDAFVLSPAAHIKSNNHVWSIGPALLFSYGDQIEQRESPKLTGLTLGYTNYLIETEEKVSLFFALDLWLQRVSDVQESRYFDTGTNSFESFTIKQTDNTAQLFVGFGAMVKLSDQVSIKQTISTGVNFTSRSATSPFNNFTDPLISQDWLLKTGLFYRLN
ncbi:MAG: hypothetical protein RIM99_10685 [Cyclobacteriaceae bacterium]